MTSDGVPGGDRDLLARLNALKTTHIDLDDKKYKIPIAAQLRPTPSEVSPAKALHSDLLSRFHTLNGKPSTSNFKTDFIDSNDHVVLDEDNKTVEELLADLGPDEPWNIDQNEETQISNLLSAAKLALDESKPEPDEKQEDGNDLIKNPTSHTHILPNIDLELYQPEAPSSDDEDNAQPRKSKSQLEAEIERDAEEIVAKIKAEVENAKITGETTPPKEELPNSQHETKSSENEDISLPSVSSLDLPSTPSKDPIPPPQASTNQNEDQDQDDLASRFASLSLPSVPSTLHSSATSNTKSAPTSKFTPSYTDEEIDSWCIICNEDATLSCRGCDDNLYCTKCWLEGHRGPDAGLEEKTHRAVTFNKGGGMKKEKETRRKVGVGA